MRIGTAHFKSVKAAEAYYRKYGENAIDVAQKIQEGSIAIGSDGLKLLEGDKIILDKSDGRYYIQTSNT
jgi:hypothetical protein